MPIIIKRISNGGAFDRVWMVGFLSLLIVLSIGQTGQSQITRWTDGQVIPGTEELDMRTADFSGLAKLQCLAQCVLPCTAV